MPAPIASPAHEGITKQPSIEELRREFASKGLEGWLWTWVTQILLASVFARIKPRYAGKTYSPSCAWDAEGAWDLVQDFIIERGVDGGAIQAALTVALQPSGVKKYLEKALLNFTISERRRDTVSNVRSRLSDVLQESPLLRCLAGFGMRAAYGLEEWSENPPATMDSADVRGAERFFPAGVKLTSYSTGTRQSPGLASADLAQIAGALISGTGKLWTANQVMTLVESRFVLSEGDPNIPTDSERELIRMRAPEGIDVVVVKELAADALQALSDSQRAIFQLMVEEPNLSARALADRTGVSKSQVNKEQHRIAAILSSLPLVTSEEQEQFLNAVTVLLRGQEDALGSSTIEQK